MATAVYRHRRPERRHALFIPDERFALSIAEKRNRQEARTAVSIGAPTTSLPEFAKAALAAATQGDVRGLRGGLPIFEQLLRRKLQAIVTGGKHAPRSRKLLSNAKIPVIEKWDMLEKPIGYYVGFSSAAAVHVMVDHFGAVGYHRTAFICGDRRVVFIAALRDHGWMHHD